jgi:hypothetical protein
LAESFQAENIGDVENMCNIVEDLHNEELHGEMDYISEDGVEGSIGKFGCNSMRGPNSLRCTKILSQHHLFLSFLPSFFYHVKSHL